jgi:hypothetical protein
MFNTKSFSLLSLHLSGRPATDRSTPRTGIYDIVIHHCGRPLAFVDFVNGCLNASRHNTAFSLHLDAQLPFEERIPAKVFLSENHDAIVALVTNTANELGLRMTKPKTKTKQTRQKRKSNDQPCAKNAAFSGTNVLARSVRRKIGDELEQHRLETAGTERMINAKTAIFTEGKDDNDNPLLTVIGLRFLSFEWVSSDVKGIRWTTKLVVARFTKLLHSSVIGCTLLLS